MKTAVYFHSDDGPDAHEDIEKRTKSKEVRVVSVMRGDERVLHDVLEPEAEAWVSAQNDPTAYQIVSAE